MASVHRPLLTSHIPVSRHCIQPHLLPDGVLDRGKSRNCSRITWETTSIIQMRVWPFCEWLVRFMNVVCWEDVGRIMQDDAFVEFETRDRAQQGTTFLEI